MNELATLARELVRIDSLNPGLVPGGAGESRIAGFVADWCAGAGLEVEVGVHEPGRESVIATGRGRGGGRTLLLDAHTDTVGVAGMAEPFSGRIEGGRLYGRGAYDMKAALAAAMLAVRDASRLELRGDVVLAAVADEELGSLGTEWLVPRVEPDAAIVPEPTELRLAVAHKGFVAFEVETLGRAAHGSRPDLGVDAIARMGPVLVRLTELDARLRRRSGHPLLGPGSVHASVVSGGQEYSSYPASCSVKGERRTVPGETLADVEAEVEWMLGDVEGTFRLPFWREPLETSAESDLVELVHRHAGRPEICGLPFWTDAALLAAAGIPTVLFGPSGEGAHAEVEWVDLASAERCREVFVAVAAELCA